MTGLATEEREDVFGWIKEEHRLSTKKLVYIGEFLVPGMEFM